MKSLVEKLGMGLHNSGKTEEENVPVGKPSIVISSNSSSATRAFVELTRSLSSSDTIMTPPMPVECCCSSPTCPEEELSPIQRR